MKEFNISYDYNIDNERGITLRVKNDLNGFNSELLNIGDISAPSKPVEVLAVIFDLEGFTNFTRQVDPKLAIPSFINDFFNWLFDKIKDESKVDDKQNLLWAELPFFSKFLGDGVLFLWKIDTDKIAFVNKKLDSNQLNELIQELLCNIIATLYNICNNYSEFLNDTDLKYVDPPTKLRCGVARGDVFPIGLNRDYVGPCINIASRLQKFNGLSFGVCARGIDHDHLHDDYNVLFLKKRVSIRGIGENEIIYVLKSEYENLSKETQKAFK